MTKRQAYIPTFASQLVRHVEPEPPPPPKSKERLALEHVAERLGVALRVHDKAKNAQVDRDPMHVAWDVAEAIGNLKRNAERFKEIDNAMRTMARYSLGPFVMPPWMR